jgi:lipoyl(octanoyl) transferase
LSTALTDPKAELDQSKFSPLEIFDLGCREYSEIYEQMRTFTAVRDGNTPDQIWLVEHPPVFTLGQAGDSSHLLDEKTAIPVVKVDRGGQITYHGPGQIVVYLLLDLKRHGFYVRELVTRMEQAMIDTLKALRVDGDRQKGAPGIYLGHQPGYEHLKGAKIAALGLKVSRHYTYHGLALNVDMDLQPFRMINPCGYEGLRTIDLKTLGISENRATVANILIAHLKESLNLA